MAEEKCGVVGCTQPGIRSYSRVAVERGGLKVADEKAKRVHLCKEHNKEFKKATRDERKIESLGR